MRCPACQAEIPDDASQCPVCSTVLGASANRRKPRRRAEGLADAEALRSAAYDLQVKRVVLLCLVAIVPGLGLLLGPVTALLITLLILRARKDPAFTALRGARVTLVVALVVTACNWVGLWLMVRSWAGDY
jgi:hypothetical protein